MRLDVASLASRTFIALRHRNYRLFFMGQAFSLTGNWVQIVAESWLIYKLTGSPLALGLLSVVALLPVIPVSLFGAALIDRISKRNLLLATQSGLMVTYLILAMLTWSGLVQVWHIVVIDFVAGALSSIDLPARQAFLAEIVERDDLPNSIALNTLLFNFGRIAGPSAAGLIIIGFGEAGCFFVNSMSYLPLILGLLMMRGLRPVTTKDKRTLAGNVVQGLSHMRRDWTFIWLLALMSISVLLLMPYATMMAVFAKDVLQTGPEGLGLLMTGIGLGAAIGSLWLTRLKAKDQQRWLAISLYTLALAVLALTRANDLTFAFAAALLVGVGTTWMQTIFNTLVQLHVPDEMRGRMMSMYLSLFVGMQRLGALQAGFFAEWVGIATALAGGTVVSLFCTTVALWRKPSEMSGPSPSKGSLGPESAGSYSLDKH